MENPLLNCFWCGEPLGFFWFLHETVVVGGKPEEMHRGPFKNCVKEYLKWDTQISETATEGR